MLLTLLAACTVWVDPVADAPFVARQDARSEVELWFCPDDDVVAAELAEIRRVVEEHAASPDGEGYRIRYAVYNLRNPDIVQALGDAWLAGVDVQVMIEKDQLSPALDYNTADEALAAVGMTVIDNHRNVPDDERDDVDVIGISGSGLMHLKTRLYETPTSTVLITGSHNPGDNATFNDETWHRITAPDVVAAYQATVDAVLHDGPIVNDWHDDDRVHAMFSPQDDGPATVDHIFDWLLEEDEQILLAVYSLRDLTAPSHDLSLVELLGAKVAAGVPVVVITDRKQSDAWGDPTEDRLRAVGVHVYEATNAFNEYTAMHAKLAVLGRTEVRVISDAANWSASGLGTATKPSSNTESTLFFEAEAEEGRVGHRALAQWMRWLRRYADQSAADGEPSAAALTADWIAAEGWPTHTVGFAVDVDTAWGEQVRVVGDAPELGLWGAAHEGLLLQTSSTSYPEWSASVELPVGIDIAWKLVIDNGKSWRWEDGDNRSNLIQLPVSGDLLLDGAWR